MLLDSNFSNKDFNSWMGELKLNFEFRLGRSILVNRWSYGPFVVQKPFYYDDNVPHVYLLHPPGGLVGGDCLNLEVNLESGSHALLTTPGATKFYRSEQNYSYLQQQFILRKDSCLEWLPQCNIFFPESEVIIKSVLYVSDGARFIIFEVLCFSYLVLHEWLEKETSLDVSLCIHLDNDLVGLKNRLKMNYSNKSYFEKLGGCQVFATFYAMPVCSTILDQIRYIIGMYNPIAGGATLLGNILIVRLLDDQDQKIRDLFYDLWCFLRPIIFNKKVVVPRIWMT